MALLWLPHTERQQNRRLLSQLYEFADNLMIGQDDHHYTQAGNGANTTGQNATSNNKHHLAPVNGSQVDLHTLDRSIAERVRK